MVKNEAKGERKTPGLYMDRISSSLDVIRHDVTSENGTLFVNREEFATFRQLGTGIEYTSHFHE